MHRYLSLAVAIIWLLQALTGIALSFHRHWEDHVLGVSGRAVDAAATAAAIDRIAARTPVVELFAGGAVPGRFDVLLEPEGEHQRRVWIDGADGRVLGGDLWKGPLTEMQPFQLVYRFHNDFFAGPVGKRFVSLSGLLLITNILLGLRIAWPQGGRWRQVLIPPRTRSRAASLMLLHRAVGFWFAPVALFVLVAGTLMVWRGEIESSLGVAPGKPGIASTSAPVIVQPADAIRIAQKRYPDGELAILVLPTDERPWYLVRLTRPGELRATLGTTIVYVDAAEGRVLSAWSPLDGHPVAAAVDSLYALHTGEWAGNAGRLVTMLAGLWLVALILIGFQLWRVRRKRG